MIMYRRTLRRTATTLAAFGIATGVTIATADTAHAEDRSWHSVVTSDAGAVVGFRPYGEHIRVCDMRRDGRYPGVWYKVDNGHWINKRYILGAGNCHDINLDLPESSYVWIKAVNYEKGHAMADSKTIKVSARG